MTEPKRATLGVITIAVIMFFVGVATDVFWVGRFVAGMFPSTMGVEDRVYKAFAVPDLVLSILLYIGAFGLIKLKRFGLTASYLAMGMWMFDSFLVLGITGLSRIGIIGPSLFFVFFTIILLWTKRDIFA